jgi:hypothetical protein
MPAITQDQAGQMTVEETIQSMCVLLQELVVDDMYVALTRALDMPELEELRDMLGG